MLPSIFVMFRSSVTSSPATFLMISVSAVAGTAVSVTSVALAEDSAFSKVYPSGSLDTVTVAPLSLPSYTNSPPTVVTVIAAVLSVISSIPRFSETV